MFERTTPEEAIQGAIAAMLRDVWTCLPARVVAANLQISQVDVQPIPADYLGGEIVAMPQIPSVPILWPRAGAAVMTFPLAVGDYVLLMVSSRSIARFREDGSEGDPQSVRTHDLSDAMAIPLGLWPDSSSISASTSDVVINKPSSGQIKLGRSLGTLPIARDGDAIDMTAGFGSSWATWMLAVNAALVVAGGGVVPPPTISPEVTASTTHVEAS